jgi:hypothetical protein
MTLSTRKLKVRPDVKSNAHFSPCKRYRYWLRRVWDDQKPILVWLMCNPSVASETVEDPTVAKCQKYARAWGYGGIIVVNIFALRSTDPKALYESDSPISDPVDPERNDLTILEVCTGRRVIAAWGVHGKHLGRGRKVLELLAGKLECLKVTKDGHPGHPLYCKDDVVPGAYWGQQ